MAQKAKRSPVPPCIFVALWVLYAALFHGNITPVGIILTLIVSIAAWIGTARLFSKKAEKKSGRSGSLRKKKKLREAELQQKRMEQEARVEEFRQKSGSHGGPTPVYTPPKDPEIAAMIKEGERAITEMRRLNQCIDDPKISVQINELESTTRKIFDHVTEHPEKLSQIRRFMNYYLPTTIKLLNAYDRMGDQGIAGENIDGTMGKIETMMETVVGAFHKQFDSLYTAEAMDISSDITVMENLMAQEGLLDQQIPL